MTGSSDVTSDRDRPIAESAAVSSRPEASQAESPQRVSPEAELRTEPQPQKELAVKLLHPAAHLPRRAHPGDAGADLFSVEEMVIPPGERRDVGTGVALAIPAGQAGFVQPRSGLAFKHGIMVVNSPGLIDAGYRGEVRVSLYNSGARPFVVAVGERIAQLVIQRVEEPTFVAADELPQTVRGDGGFGSSGR